MRETAYEAQRQPHEVVLLDELVQVDGQQLEANTQVAAEVKVLLRTRTRRNAWQPSKQQTSGDQPWSIRYAGVAHQSGPTQLLFHLRRLHASLPPSRLPSCCCFSHLPRHHRGLHQRQPPTKLRCPPTTYRISYITAALFLPPLLQPLCAQPGTHTAFPPRPSPRCARSCACPRGPRRARAAARAAPPAPVLVRACV